MRRYLGEVSVGLSVLALSGMCLFLVDWGSMTQKVQSHVSNELIHPWVGDDRHLGERLDSMERRMSDMLRLQNDILSKLGKLEGKYERDS